MQEIKLLIDGEWRAGSGPRIPVLNPATGEPFAEITGATQADLDAALDAAERGFEIWRDVSAFDRCKVLRKAADLLRERSEDVAAALSQEQGKPLAQAKMELVLSADTIDFFAEECRRTYGKVIPGRTPGQQLMSLREPIGPVAAFTPWNFPVLQAVRKVSPALATGCSVILKAPEDTPASCAMLVQIFLDAGLPAPVLSLVYGNPPEISEYLIPHRVIRKVSFTGSTAVGKHLAAMAGAHMKRITMELGGHAPAVVFDDADPAQALQLISGAKFYNSGQVCISPTRVMVHDRHFDQFVDGFVAAAKALKVGPGNDPASGMGPLVNQKRLDDVSAIVSEAVADGATLRTGGKRIGNEGFFFEPTVLTDVPVDARIMNDEPFGPVALINRFSDDDEVMAEMNRLDYGLATYAYTRDADRIQRLSRRAETGMLAINSQSVSFVEAPFGGVKDSGYGSESGAEAMDSYLNVKQVNVNL
jgi:succinate-semialdehyde dehydrogenase/glutarate-semialdehyde dehydrogenase